MSCHYNDVLFNVYRLTKCVYKLYNLISKLASFNFMIKYFSLLTQKIFALTIMIIVSVMKMATFTILRLVFLSVKNRHNGVHELNNYIILMYTFNNIYSVPNFHNGKAYMLVRWNAGLSDIVVKWLTSMYSLIWGFSIKKTNLYPYIINILELISLTFVNFGTHIIYLTNRQPVSQ